MTAHFAGPELELRLLPGVSLVSIRETSSVTHVQLFADVDDPAELRREASRIVSAHLAPPTSIEVVTPARERVRVVEVRPTDIGLEVELAHGERVGASTASSAEREHLAAATIAALERLGATVPFRVIATETVSREGADATVVMLREGQHARFGIASGTHETAVVRATLCALNRHLVAALAS